MISYIPFFFFNILFLFSIFIFLNKDNNCIFKLLTKIFTIVIIVSITFFVGLKSPFFGNDTPSYYAGYQLLSSFEKALFHPEIYFGSKEFLFWPFSYIFKFIGFSFQSYFIFYVLFFLVVYSFSVTDFISNRTEVLVVLSFLALSYFMVFLSNNMRQVLSIVFTMLYIRYCNKKEYGKCLLYYFVSLGFHVSAVVYILYPLFLKVFKNRNNSHVFVFVCSMFIISFISKYFIGYFSDMSFLGVNDKINLYASDINSHYTQLVYQTSNFWILMILFFAITYFFRFPHNDTFLLYGFSLIFVIVSSQFAEMSQRFMLLPYLVLPLLIPKIISNMRYININVNLRWLLIIITISSCCAYSYFVYSNYAFLFNFYGVEI